MLTAAQSLFGVAVLASLSFSLVEAALLAGLFTAQIVLGGVLRAGMHDPTAAAAEMTWFTILYVVLGVVFLFVARTSLLRRVRMRRKHVRASAGST